MRVAVSDSFVDAMSTLDPTSARRVMAFLGKVVREPDSTSIHLETLHEAADKADRSLRVTGELRAIGHLVGDALVLVFVGEHDRAYRWARDHCVTCHPATHEVEIGPVGGTEDATATSRREHYRPVEELAWMSAATGPEGANGASPRALPH